MWKSGLFFFFNFDKYLLYCRHILTRCCVCVFFVGYTENSSPPPLFRGTFPFPMIFFGKRTLLAQKKALKDSSVKQFQENGTFVTQIPLMSRIPQSKEILFNLKPLNVSFSNRRKKVIPILQLRHFWTRQGYDTSPFRWLKFPNLPLY